MIDDVELARRSILGFGEMVAALGLWGVGPEAEVRRPDALGRGSTPRSTTPGSTRRSCRPVQCRPPTIHCCRTASGLWPTPYRGEWRSRGSRRRAWESRSTTRLWCSTVARRMSKRPRSRCSATSMSVPTARAACSVRSSERFATAGSAPTASAMEANSSASRSTMAVGDDLSIQYVATEADYRRRGLASSLLVAVLAAARAEGLRSATLQASPDGLSVYERLGFRRVARLRGFLRTGGACQPGAAIDI